MTYAAAAQRVIVIGLDCAAPQLVFDRFAPDLKNIGKLRDQGLWGELASVVPAITVPAWACSMTSQDPGQLGIYGFRNRKDHSYDAPSFATANLLKKDAVWDILSRQGKSSILLGVPPSYPPKPLNGCCVGCFLTPNTNSEYTYPAQLKNEIEAVVGPYMIDVENFRSSDNDRILADARKMASQRFRLFRHLLRTRPWHFAMMVEIGLDRIHHGFWQHFDDTHIHHQPNNPYQDAVRHYYQLLDREIGTLIAELPQHTTVLVMSDHGAKPMAGAIRINQWLINHGYLNFKSTPSTPTRFSTSDVHWPSTRAWAEGGYYARIFLNVRGREPEGIVHPSDYEPLRDELIQKIAAIPDHQGNSLNTDVFRPQDIYREVRNVPPDLIVYFGNLEWRAAAQVGTDQIYTFDNDTGPDGANHAQEGMFILNGPQVGRGKRNGVKLLDCAPTVLDQLGMGLPDTMIGQRII